MTWLACVLVSLGGDPIVDAATTDGTGGLSGRPMVLVETTGTRVRQLRVVAFDALGVVDVTRLQPVAYLDMATIATTIPTYGATTQPWGNAGLAGGNRPTTLATYDIDLALPPGRHLVGLTVPSPLRVSGSRSADGLPAWYERPGEMPRTALGGRRWALALMTDQQSGDFNADGKLDGADLAQWSAGYGTTYTGVDLLNWQGQGGVDFAIPTAAVMEPATWAMAMVACCFFMRRNRCKSNLRRPKRTNWCS